MPELKNNFTGGKMEKDLDERLVPNGQYRDAWNIQVATSEESDLGSIQNILGNTKIDNSIIPGDSVCVGSIADDKNNKLYLLLASSSKDMIIEWDPIEEEITPVFVSIQTSTNPGVLKFSKSNIITGINIIDDMLFWTDNVNEPKRINIPRSKEGTDNAGQTITRLINPDRNINYLSGVYMKEEYITVIKKGPKIPPSLRLESKGSSAIRLYCDQPTAAPFSSSTVGLNSEVDLLAYDLIPGYYGNALHDYYKIGDTIYLKAVAENVPNTLDPKFDDYWSNGSDGSYDIKLLITDIGDTDGSSGSSLFGGTYIACTISGPSDVNGELIGNLYGQSYTITNLNEPPIIFEKKFPRFATRWKYADGEYSAFSPFSQIAFAPGNFNYHPKKGHNLGMVNTLFAAHIEQFIPINLPSDVVAVDILYREAGSPNIYIIDTITKNDPPIVGKSFNYWDSFYDHASLSPDYSGCGTGQCYDPSNINWTEPSEQVRMKGTYKITSDNISKAIPENQTIRHWDNVPRKALAQEVIGSRLVYGNYQQNYNLIEGSDPDSPYRARFELDIENYNPIDTQEVRGTYYTSKPSIKSLRTYQVGIVYEDNFGRQTPVLTSASGVLNTEKSIAKSQHRLVVKQLTEPPYWATNYRYFIKETSTEYYNLAMDRVYDAEDGNVWLAFPSSDRAKVDEEDYLILKKDNTGAFVEQQARYKILAIENNVPEFVKTRQRALGNVEYVTNNTNTGAWDPTTFTTPDDVPVKDSLFFTINSVPSDMQNLVDEYADSIGWTAPTSPLVITPDIHKISLRIVDDSNTNHRGKSDWYEVKKLICLAQGATSMTVHMERSFDEDIEFSYKTNAGEVTNTYDTTAMYFRVGKEEYKSWFDGRFFVKIERDATVDSRVVSTSKENWIKTAKGRIHYIHSGEGDAIWKNTPNVSGTTVYKPPSSSVTTMYAGQSGTGQPEAKFNGGFRAYGDVVGSRIVNAIGCTNGSFSGSNCSASATPSTSDNCSDGTPNNCLEAHIPQAGAERYQIDALNNFSTTHGEKFPPLGAGHNMNVWGHYIGVYDYEGDGPSQNYAIPNASEPGIWFIDRTFYSTNMTTNPNANSVTFKDSFGDKWENGTFPMANISRMKGLDCDSLLSIGGLYTMDLSFAGILDSSQQDTNQTNNLPLSPSGGFDGSLPASYSFSFLDNPLHAKDHDFASKLRVGAKVQFSDDQTGDDGGPITRTITSIHGPWSIVSHNRQPNWIYQSGGAAIPNDPFSFRVSWRIAFDKPFGNPVRAQKGYNPLYTLKDVQYVDNDGVTVRCPRTECTGGATYPWSYAQPQATAYSQEYDHYNNGSHAGNAASPAFTPTFMEILEDHKSIGDDEKVVSKNPVIWETEPKRDSDLDIYYEASGSYPVNIAQGGENPILRIGAYVRVSKSNPDYYSQQLDSNGESWLQRNNLDGHQIAAWDDSIEGSNSPIIIGISGGTSLDLGTTVNVNGDVRLETGTILDVIFKGSKIEVEVAQDYEDNGFTGWIDIREDFTNNRVSLDWHNCWVFGDNIGVESDRIKDDFNAVRLDNGPKASTTVVEGRYKEERRKSGLIYSGLYNSMSGINNLNQFIIGEKITKNLNPTYGSIQKLHTRDTDLVTLCENKVLRILANKDALFNADGNLSLTATQNVLGQAVPFVGEYGISKNPESFASEAYRAYFTDANRGVALRLSRDGLTPISEHGMRNWFNDYFVTNKKDLNSDYIIGSYDRRKQNYNVTFADKTVSFNEGAKGWVSFQSMSPNLTDWDGTSLDTSSEINDFHGVSLNNKYYTFRKGGLWEQHAKTSDWNSMYGFSVKSSVTTILNDSPEIVKSFNTLNYEGSQSRIEEITTQTIDGTVYNDQQYYNLVAKEGWSVDSIITDKGKSTEQHGTLNEFIEKEGKWFNYIKGVSTNLQNIDPCEVSLQGLGVAASSTINYTLYGCTSPTAINYNVNATDDDGSCVECVYGCTDSQADNHSPNATCDDGSCQYIGCTVAGAYNYDSNANVSCSTPYLHACCVEWIYGCTDSAATNYDGPFDLWGTPANTMCNANPTYFNAGNGYAWSEMDHGVKAGDATTNCCIYPAYGCTDPASCNYDSSATVDDGSCYYSCIGCNNPNACNYDASYTGCVNTTTGAYEPNNEDCCHSCIYGCTNQVANNYGDWTPPADTPCDGSSISNNQNTNNACINGQTGSNCCCDTSTPTGGYNCVDGICESTTNMPQYASLIECTDSGCLPPGNYGCTDSTAANWDPTAGYDDGTCCYGGCSQGGSSVGKQPDINGFCGNPNCMGPPNYVGCTYVDICDPSSGVYTGCSACHGMAACNSQQIDCGYTVINYDPDLCYDCGEANSNTDCYDCLDNLNGSDTSCCIDTLPGCMDPTATNYDADVTYDDGSCVYPQYGCLTDGYCNYCASGAASPGNPGGGPGCNTACATCCELQTCEGCIDTALGFFAGVMIDGTRVCRGTTNANGNQTTNLWYSAAYDEWFCSVDFGASGSGSLNLDDGSGNENRDGWNAKNYCPDCDLPAYWGMTSHNSNNLPVGENCQYHGAGCTDGGQYDPSTTAGSNYINQAAVNSGLGTSPTNTPGYIWGSLTPGAPAFNFDPLASSDDGSCYPVIYGCQDNTAINENEPCVNGNFGWGAWNGAPSGNLFEDTNTSNPGCCQTGVTGCTDNSANQYMHDDLPFDDDSDGMKYMSNWLFTTNNHKGYWLNHNNHQGANGAWNYDPAATVLQPGPWEADVQIEDGWDASNVINGNVVASEIEPGCANDPAVDCYGTGNEDGCCYMAGCLDPTAFNYEYNGFGGKQRHSAKDGGGLYGSGSTALQFFYEGETQGLGSQLHRVCADCLGTPATAWFVNPDTGLGIGGTPTPGAYLSAARVKGIVGVGADLTCCCYNKGCMDPTACNYNPLACLDDGSCAPPTTVYWECLDPGNAPCTQCYQGSACGTTPQCSAMGTWSPNENICNQYCGVS